MENSKAAEEEIVHEYVDRMVALQQTMEQPRDELNDIRREARAGGLNVEALNVLVPLISKYPHDKGAGVLSEVIRYTEIFGAEILVSGANAGSPCSPKPTSSTDAAQPASAEVRSPAASDRDSAAHTSLRLSTQVIAAVGLTIGLIWLLN